MSDLPDSGHRTNFNTGAVRDASEGKGHPSSIPPTAIRRIAKRFEDGARKYKNANWAQGMPISRTADSALRHIASFLEGDKTEDHLGAAAWNICVLMQFEEWLGKGLLPEELDDRLYSKENPVAWAREQCAKSGSDDKSLATANILSVAEELQESRHMVRMDTIREGLQSIQDNPTGRWAVVLRHDLSNYIGVFIKQRDAEDFVARLAAATNGHCEFDIIALP